MHVLLSLVSIWDYSEWPFWFACRISYWYCCCYTDMAVVKIQDDSWHRVDVDKKLVIYIRHLWNDVIYLQTKFGQIHCSHLQCSQCLEPISCRCQWCVTYSISPAQHFKQSCVLYSYRFRMVANTLLRFTESTNVH